MWPWYPKLGPCDSFNFLCNISFPACSSAGGSRVQNHNAKTVVPLCNFLLSRRWHMCVHWSEKQSSRWEISAIIHLDSSCQKISAIDNGSGYRLFYRLVCVMFPLLGLLSPCPCSVFYDVSSGISRTREVTEISLRQRWTPRTWCRCLGCSRARFYAPLSRHQRCRLPRKIASS